MSKDRSLHIEWLEDEHECDTCGTSWARGATVTLDGVVIVSKIPHANCFGGSDYDDDEIFEDIIKALGYELTQS